MKSHILLFLMLFAVVSDGFCQRSEYMKLSPSLKAVLLEGKSTAFRGQKHLFCGVKAPLLVFVKSTSCVSDTYNDLGCEVLASFGDIEIVSVPRENILALASDSRIERIETGWRKEALNVKISEQINANPAHEGRQLPQAYTGKGVVLGIQDIGFDLTNPNFYSTDMSEYRIKALWDMLSTDTIDSQMPVGQEYRGEENILAYAHTRDAFITNHGTHTLGTAAGSGFGSPYRGMAFDSDICVVSNAVSNNAELISEADQDKHTYAMDALGFKYIFDYAESVGRPCIISFSEGSPQDLYGDNMLYYEVLSRLVGPGRILVASAGNNSQENCYLHKQAGRKSAGTFIEIWGNQIYFMAQADKDFTAQMVIHSPNQPDTLNVSTQWLCQQPDSLAFDTLEVDGREYAFAFGAYPSCYDPERLVVEYSVSGPMHIGMQSLCPFSVEFIGMDADIEAYKLLGNFVNKSANPELCHSEVSHNIHAPSSSPDVICVGATAYVTSYVNMQGETKTYDYGENGIRASFSSVGPTIDGRMKPEVMAPGANIISSSSSYFFEANPESAQVSDLVEAFDHNGRTYYWKADTGTSMSTPAVAGAIALWLEAKPDLTREEIVDILAHTCTHPDESLSYPNNQYGYGQIDVYRGLLYILGVDKIEEVSQKQPAEVTFRVQGNGCFDAIFDKPLAKSAEIKVYSLSGILLKTVVADCGSTTVRVEFPMSGNGVVAVQVNGDGATTTGSTLLRL